MIISNPLVAANNFVLLFGSCCPSVPSLTDVSEDKLDEEHVDDPGSG